MANAPVLKFAQPVADLTNLLWLFAVAASAFAVVREGLHLLRAAYAHRFAHVRALSRRRRVDQGVEVLRDQMRVAHGRADVRVADGLLHKRRVGVLPREPTNARSSRFDWSDPSEHPHDSPATINAAPNGDAKGAGSLLRHSTYACLSGRSQICHDSTPTTLSCRAQPTCLPL